MKIKTEKQHSETGVTDKYLLIIFLSVKVSSPTLQRNFKINIKQYSLNKNCFYLNEFLSLTKYREESWIELSGEILY